MDFKKGLGLSIIWADVPVERAAAFDEWASGEAIGGFSRASGVLSVARYLAVSGGPHFVEVYELSDRGAAASEECGRLQEATLQALERAGSISYIAGGGAATVTPKEGLLFSCNVYRQIFPPALDERYALHGPAAALQIGRIDIQEAHEEEFNDWYNGEYLINYLKVPGVYGARRYINEGAGFKYLTVYELAHAGVSRQLEWDRVRAQSVWRRRIERFWSHAQGSPGIYQRVAVS